MLDFSRCRLKPFQHQREDVETMVRLPWLFITSEMRTGKTKIVIDAAQFLWGAGTIDRVLVVAPAPVRDVWYDIELGELQKHLWLKLPAQITEFHSRNRRWMREIDALNANRVMEWMVTNYEFIRSKNRLIQLLPFCTQKTLLVLDESSFVKNHDAAQTKACFQLRANCGRVVLLNGTPISHSPLDLFSQGNLLNAGILQCKYITHYKARYAVETPVLSTGGKVLTSPRGFAIKTITGWTNLDDLQRRFAPYTIRRLQKDCLDLPPKLDSVTLTAELTPETWRVYKDMRDELMVWLKNGNVATAPQAATRTLRLAQITSGILGGIEDAGIEETVEPGLIDSTMGSNSSSNCEPNNHVWSNQFGDDWTPEDNMRCDCGAKTWAQRQSFQIIETTNEIGREKLDVLLWFLGQRLEADHNLHIVVWCRFRYELARMLNDVRQKFPQFEVGEIRGGQKKSQRQYAMSLLKPETSPKGPVFVGGTYGTGSFGLDFTAAHTSVNMSFDFSLGKFLQSGDRVYGPGQKSPVAYFDIVAVGPRGQKTIDHHIVKTRRTNEDVATWTTAAWIKALGEE